MKKIVLSADGPLHICLVPDIVADNLLDYIDDFYDHAEKFKLIKYDDGKYAFTESEVDGFIHWLNRMFKEQSNILEVVENTRWKEYEDLPWWNW